MAALSTRLIAGKVNERTCENSYHPLHNNLAARRRARKRDVSFGPRAEEGKQARDRFMTLADTATQLVRHANQALKDALTEVKTLVQDVAHCRARLVHNVLGRVLIFDEHSPYASASLLLSGQVAFQHVLPFCKSLDFLRPETT